MKDLLSRDRITSASKIMLPFYPIFSLAIGLSYILGDPERTSTPAFHYVREIAPLSTWGWAFLVIALLEVLALWKQSRYFMVTALAIAVGAYLAWSLSFVVSIIQTDDASLTAPWLWLLASVAHYASLSSVTKD